MKQALLTIVENKPIAKDIFECTLSGEMAKYITAPGQFINIQLPGYFLKRPISICKYDIEKSELTIIYKILGKGTQKLSTLKEGIELDCLGPLGNGFNIDDSEKYSIISIVGGGVGVPPLYTLVKKIKEKYPEKKIEIYLGFQSDFDSFYISEFSKFGEVYISTMDGSEGLKGTVIQSMQNNDIEYIYACGPNAMLKAIHNAYPNTEGSFSLEERMACGFGVCMGCVCKTNNEKGYIRICKEGPVISKNTLIYE